MLDIDIKVEVGDINSETLQRTARRSGTSSVGTKAVLSRDERVDNLDAML